MTAAGPEPVSVLGRTVACGLLLLLTLLPLSYLRGALRARREGRFDDGLRGVRVKIDRAAQPRRFAWTTWGLIVSMGAFTALLCGFALLVALSP